MPLVRLSQDDLFRLVIPVPESYVRFVKVGDSVEVRVPALNRTLTGKVARFSVDVKADTRTMHTEVDVPTPTANSSPACMPRRCCGWNIKTARWPCRCWRSITKAAK